MHRYHAARAAALAGCGQGRDAADLDEKGRAAFRRQALDWLRAELEVRRRLVETDPAGFHVGMEHWLEDPDFAGVRGPEALARLPEAERQAWQKLWVDVADTLARAQGKAPPEPKAGSKIPLPER
jgi:serine/threonine-protein kinase